MCTRGGQNCALRAGGGVPLRVHLAPVLGNNALGATPRRWLCVAPRKQQVTTEYSCLRGLLQSSTGTRRATAPRRYTVSRRAGYNVSVRRSAESQKLGQRRLVTFVSRTDFLPPSCAKPFRNAPLAFRCLIWRKTSVEQLRGAVALLSLCLHACVSVPVVRPGETCGTVTNINDAQSSHMKCSSHLFALLLKSPSTLCFLC